MKILSELVLLHLGPKLRMLEKVKMMEGVRITGRSGGQGEPERGAARTCLLYETCIVLLFKILQIGQKVDECRLFKDVLLCEGVQIEWICQGLHKFQLQFKSSSIQSFRVILGSGRTGIHGFICQCHVSDALNPFPRRHVWRRRQQRMAAH